MTMTEAHRANRWIAAGLIILVLITIARFTLKHEKNETSSPVGLILEFDFNPIERVNANRFAIWVEDGDGAYVKTLFVCANTSDAVQSRETLPRWVSVSDVATMSQAMLDALVAPVPEAGTQTFIWDLTDAEGTPILAGRYSIYLEASLGGSDSVIYSTTLRIDDTEKTMAVASGYYGSDEADRDMISNVGIVYFPIERTVASSGIGRVFRRLYP
jgi:hypothetical protein